MIEILWEFVVRKEKTSEFEHYYNHSGAWAQLFRKCPAYHSTTLLRESGNRYVTRDCWESLAAFDDFRRGHAQEYDELDRLCEGFTESERRLGVFEVI